MPVQIIGSGVLNQGTKAIMYGKPEAMKSIASKRLLLNVGDGRPWLGLSVPRVGVKVLYVQLEIPDWELQQRMLLMANGTGGLLQAETFIWNVSDLVLDQPLGQRELEDEIAELGVHLVIIDPIYKVVAGDMSQAVYMKQLFDYLDRLVRKYRVSVLLIHHQRKGGAAGNRQHAEEDADEMIGSFEFRAWPDTIISVKRMTDGLSEWLRFRFEKKRHGRKKLADIKARIDEHLTLTPMTEVKE